MKRIWCFAQTWKALCSLAIFGGSLLGAMQWSSGQSTDQIVTSASGQRWVIRQTKVARRVGGRLYHEIWIQRIPIGGRSLPPDPSIAMGEGPTPLVVQPYLSDLPKMRMPIDSRPRKRIMTDQEDLAPVPQPRLNGIARSRPEPDPLDEPSLKSESATDSPANPPSVVARTEPFVPDPNLLHPNSSGRIGRQSLEAKRAAWRMEMKKIGIEPQEAPAPSMQHSADVAPLPDTDEEGPPVPPVNATPPSNPSPPPAKVAESKASDAHGVASIPAPAPPPKPTQHPLGIVSGIGFVKSPYPPHRTLDVRGMPSGSLAKDPATGEIFRVP